MNALGTYRLERGLSQMDVARVLKTSKATISRYESGIRRIPVHVAKLIHAEFGIPLNEIRPDIWGQQ
ncbi:MAG TPA: helix-turn-helix transcriptional regulator [Aestuariivirga sp.]|nr:helix-turn-helix transcriptional regulator [Aestuariivirga sp.]